MFELDILVEFVGTLFFIAIIILSGGQPWAVGAALAGAIFIGGISGCQSNNFNPAVSLTMYFRGVMPAYRCAGYILAQILGGMSAMYLVSRYGKNVSEWVHKR
jgi:glycerol uptake facilitator-like aquaporin